MATNELHKPERPHTVRTRVSGEELQFLRLVAVKDNRTVANVLLTALKEYYDRNVDRVSSHD